MLPSCRKPTLPGKILWEEFLLPLGYTQSQFAKHLGESWTPPKLSIIINGKQAITEEIALDLADALGTSAEFWIPIRHEFVGSLTKAQKKNCPNYTLAN